MNTGVLDVVTGEVDERDHRRPGLARDRITFLRTPRAVRPFSDPTRYHRRSSDDIPEVARWSGSGPIGSRGR